jgi:hypothetical protein
VTVQRLFLVVAMACCVAGCASPATHGSSSPSTHSTAFPPSLSVPPTTLEPASNGATTPTSAVCANGTTAVTAEPGGQATPVCVHVGTTVTLRGGTDMSGGTWTGPPEVSDDAVVSLQSTHSVGANFTASVRAVGIGSATVTVPFQAGRDVCDPTPCTPVPGAPLVFALKVVP